MPRTTPSAAILLVCALGAACAPDGAQEDAGPPPNVLLVVVDTLRADRLGCYGAERPTSPATDALAAESVRFERAYATSPWTMPSVASMLTGLYPSRHQVTRVKRHMPKEVRTLAEILSERGYATIGVVSHKLVGSKKNFQQGFEEFDEDEARGHKHVSTRRVTHRAVGHLARLAEEERPFFLFVHYFDPHYDYQRHADVGFAGAAVGRIQGGEGIEVLRAMEDVTAGEAGFLRDLYDEEVRFTDEGIGELLAELRALDLWERTLIVLTADHGEEFWEHGWLGHTRSLRDTMVRVPLLVRRPGEPLAGRSIDVPLSLVQLTPTILDVLGLEHDASAFQAPSALPLLEAPDVTGQPSIFLEVDFVPFKADNQVKETHLRGLVRGRWKLVRDTTSGVVELFDLAGDPDERRDVSGEHAERTREMLAELEVLSAEAARDPLAIEESDPDPDELEGLRGLGYVGDDEGGGSDGDDGAPAVDANGGRGAD